MIIEKARELGIAISESEEFINMTRTREAMEADEQLMANLNEYNAMQQSIMDIMSFEFTPKIKHIIYSYVFNIRPYSVVLVHDDLFFLLSQLFQRRSINRMPFSVRR